jgi:hypothetical protein
MADAVAAVANVNGTPLYPGLPPSEVRMDKKFV